MKRLVEAGARVDLADKIGGTPISYAPCNGQKTLINLLLRKGHQVDSVHDILPPSFYLKVAKLKLTSEIRSARRRYCGLPKIAAKLLLGYCLIVRLMST